MTEREYERKLDEIDRLLNDPQVSLEPGRVWSLLAEIAHHFASPGDKNFGPTKTGVREMVQPLLPSGDSRPPHPKPDPHPAPPPPIELPPHPEPIPVPEPPPRGRKASSPPATASCNCPTSPRWISAT